MGSQATRLECANDLVIACGAILWLSPIVLHAGDLLATSAYVTGWLGVLVGAKAALRLGVWDAWLAGFVGRVAFLTPCSAVSSPPSQSCGCNSPSACRSPSSASGNFSEQKADPPRDPMVGAE